MPTGVLTFFVAAIYSIIVYVAMHPMKIIQTTPPKMPTLMKLAGVAKIPMPTKTLSMLKAVWKVPTLPWTVPSPFSCGALKFLTLVGDI